MIFNQQALLLYGTDNSEQKTMILIQGKRAIYFKYFRRMAKVIYSVIIRHIVKWTVVKSVVLAGFCELGGAFLCDSAVSGCGSRWQKLICGPEQDQGKAEAETVHASFSSWKWVFVPSVLIRNSCSKCLDWGIAWL